MDPPTRNSDRKPEQTRSFECTFCKHGFTNAQALGGHMNIHRKDKQKSKEPKIKDDVVRYVSSAHQISRHSNYQVFLPSSNPSSEPDQSFGRHEDANLTSLRIRSLKERDEKDDGDHGSIDKLDLELRLGTL